MDAAAPAGSDAAPPARPRIVFFGSGAFALAVLDALLADPATVPVAIVSTPDRPAGRAATLTPTPVAARARESGADLRQPATLRDAAAVAMLAGLSPDLGVVADYGCIVPAALLAIPRRGFLNVHPSLLPRHRGAVPIPATIAEGDAETGVTVISMDAGVDTGPIVAVSRRSLDGTEDAPGLEAVLAAEGAALLRATLAPWLAGALPATPQPEAGATVTRTLRREDGRLDPAEPAIVLARRVRALRPWPGTFVETAAGRLVVLEAATLDPTPRPGPAEAGAGAAGGQTVEPGTIVADGDGLALVTAQGALRLLRVQLAGGRAMSSAELRRGRPALVDSRVAAHVRESRPS